WGGEFNHLTKSGRRLLVESRWTLVPGAEHSLPRILIINTDVSSKKKLENQLLRAQRMESIGTLASGIAHDLNNILSPIMMAIEVLGAKVADPEGQRMLSMLQKNAERGADLVRQVLQFARGAQGERVLIQPSHIVREIIKILGQTFPKSIDVRFQLPENTSTISGDATQLHQVLMNLCLNARDAMPGGGLLTIVAENVFIDEAYAQMNIGAKPGNYLCLNVADTGTGIAPDVIERMFEPFYTTKEQGKGTGLGLSTVLGIIKGHGGFVNVYSEMGKGSRFKVYLPAAREGMTAETGKSDADMPQGRGELVLVVDDEAAIREITKGTLEAFGYSVLVAADGTEAIALYAQNQTKIAVVLTDMMMPYMDGAATIRALKRINPSVKVIASSGLAANGKTVEAGTTEATDFLTKPYTAQSLLKVLNRVLTRGASRASEPE
ncbi:MAG: hybrid sensor histidine kinase/response regulator, partial [Blastocatellia bacterium]